MLTHHQQRIALGSPVDLTLVSNAAEPVIAEVFRRLWLQIFEFEQRFSRFLPASELSSFNRAAGLKTFISQEFRDILTTSRTMSLKTDGLYNPFILPALQSAGYVHSMVAAHSQDAVDDFSARTVTEPEKLRVDETWASIPYNTAIDLGGIGKGYLGDRLAETIELQPDITGYWFSLGGDIVAAGNDQKGTPWAITIENTTAPSAQYAGTASSKSAEQHAVATSSTLRRSGSAHGKAWHHIIDPRTNQPSTSDVATASVHARSLCIADILASCAIILGSTDAAQYCIDRGATGVLLQTTGGKILAFGDIEATT